MPQSLPNTASYIDKIDKRERRVLFNQCTTRTAGQATTQRGHIDHCPTRLSPLPPESLPFEVPVAAESPFPVAFAGLPFSGDSYRKYLGVETDEQLLGNGPYSKYMVPVENFMRNGI
jgi:hypothetical protein